MLKRLRNFKFKNIFKPYNLRILITGYAMVYDLQDQRNRAYKRLKRVLYLIVLISFYSLAFFVDITESFDFNFAYNYHRWW